MPRPELSIRCEIHRPWTRIDPIDRRGRIGVLDGQDVRLESPGGETIETRPGARALFRRGRRTFYWDALDLTYFLGYALWNYFTLPALLMREDIVWADVEEGVLESSFPPELPTHGRAQRHIFDRQTGLLARYEYKPEIVTGADWVANVVLERGDFEGIPYEARRKVLSMDRDTRAPQRRPVWVDMRFRDWRLL